MSVEQRLLAGLGLVLSTVSAVGKASDGPRRLLASVGWDLPPGVDDIGIGALDVGRVGERLNAWALLVGDAAASSEEEAIALAELSEAVASAVVDLARVKLDAPQDYLDRTAIGDEFLTRITDLSLIQAVAAASRPAFDLGLLVGLFELRREPADPARFQVPHLRHVVHWDRLPTLFSDPSGLLRDVYGWGTAAFDATTLVARLGAVLQPLALGIRRRDLPANPLRRLQGGEPPPAPPQTQLFVTMLGAAGPLGGEAGLTLFGLPPTAAGGADGGFGLAPYADGSADLRIALTSRLSLRMAAGTDLGTGIAAVLRPGAPPVLRIDLNEDVAGQVAPGVQVQVALTLAVPDEAEPMLLLNATGVTVQARSIAVATSVGVDGEGTDADLRLTVGGGRVVATGEGVPFLSEVLPEGGLTADLDVELSWSHQGGVRLGGSAELRTTRTINRRIGPLTIDAVDLALATSGGVALTGAVDATLALGPVRVGFEGLGVRAAIERGPGNLGSADLTVRPRAPTRLSLDVETGSLSGGGFLGFDPEHGLYAGAVQLQFEGIAFRAVGLLTTRLPGGRDGFSLLVLVSAEFPPVQLGLGFMLVGVGGLLGINRTVSVEALRAGLKTGALGTVLSPPDPVANAAQLVAGLEGLFPPAEGRYVFGPTARIVWGSPVLITIELCLVLELPSPVRLVVLGRLRAVLPDEREAVVRLQMDVLGVVDFDRREASVDATLVDSSLAGFALTGDMALRMSWGSRPSFLLAVGGFHPSFAAPPGFPALERVAVALATGENPKLRLEAYMALTSNTVQFGARIDLAAKSGGFSVAGFLSFDALVTLAPLGFTVDIAAKLAVKLAGHTITSVTLHLTLSGPRPWHAHGTASISILFFDVAFGFDLTIGDATPPPLAPPVDAASLLLGALADVRSWSAQPAGGATLVTLRARDAGSDVVAHPLGTLEVRQRVAPLERTLERFGSSVPKGANRFRIATAAIGVRSAAITGLQDLFAPGQFRALSDEQKLSLDSFEAMPSGAKIGTSDLTHGSTITLSVIYEQQLITATGIAPPPRQHLTMPADILTTLLTTPTTAGTAFAIANAA